MRRGVETALKPPIMARKRYMGLWRHSTNLNSWDVGTGLEKEFTVVLFPDVKQSSRSISQWRSRNV